jgi:hypothetical protein
LVSYADEEEGAKVVDGDGGGLALFVDAEHLDRKDARFYGPFV